MTKDQYIRKLRKQLSLQLDIANAFENDLDGQYRKFGTPELDEDDYDLEADALKVGNNSVDLIGLKLSSLDDAGDAVKLIGMKEVLKEAIKILEANVDLKADLVFENNQGSEHREFDYGSYCGRTAFANQLYLMLTE